MAQSFGKQGEACSFYLPVSGQCPGRTFAVFLYLQDY